MSNILNYTTSAFIQCTTATASTTAGTIYDILTATASVDRRIYGLAFTSTSNAANAITIYLNNGSNNIQVCTINVPANSGSTTTSNPISVQNSTMGESVFMKNRDMNGLPYLNLPKNWSVRMQQSATLGVNMSIYTFIYGENY